MPARRRVGALGLSIGWRGILGMRAKRTICLMGLIAASGFVGCNSIIGLDQFSITGKGGLPPRTAGGSRRPIVVLSCDEFANSTRAATHLIEELHVPAIVGPNTSQDTIDLSNNVSVKGGTVMMTPSAVASSIADL